MADAKKDPCLFYPSLDNQFYCVTACLKNKNMCLAYVDIDAILIILHLSGLTFSTFLG